MIDQITINFEIKCQFKQKREMHTKKYIFILKEKCLFHRNLLQSKYQ